MAKQNSPMEAGERVPNFFLKDQWNKDFHFYVSITGGPIVFVVLAPGDEGNKALLRALEKNYPNSRRKTPTYMRLATTPWCPTPP